MDRNVFGEGERLRFDLQAGLAPTVVSGGFFSLPPIDATNLIGSAKMSFVKPALYGSRDDLLVDMAAVRERTQYYWANYGNASVGVRQRFSDAASVQAGVEVEEGQYFSVFGLHDYSLLGVPLSANYDSTDSLLAPTKGIRANATVEPYFKAFGNSVGMVQSKSQVTGYYALTTTPGIFSRAASPPARSSAPPSTIFRRATSFSPAAADRCAAMNIVRSLPTTTLAFRSAAAACWKAPPKRA